MTEHVNLIVLNTTKYGENSVILHALTREYGRKSFMVKGLGRKVSSSHLQPMNILEADVLLPRKANGLATATRISSQCGLMGIRTNLSKNAMTIFMSEVLYRSIKDGVLEPGLYDLCEQNLLLLDALQTDFSNFHLWFLLEFIVELGFSPASSDLAPFLGPHTETVSRLTQSDFSSAMLVPLTGESRTDIATRLLKYIEFHTESSLQVNSLKVLSELFRA